jgi:TonB family protein
MKNNFPFSLGSVVTALLVFSLVILVSTGTAVAQDSTATKDTIRYVIVETQPEYPGGYVEMMAFIRHHLRYPKEAAKQKIEGTVQVQFIIDKTGAVDSIKTIKSLSPECDKEAERVVSMFPKWRPGQQHGKPVYVRFVLPIKFTSNLKKQK